MMDARPNYLTLARNLEQQELSSGGVCSAQIYAQLLSIYLLGSDYSNAKLLWKRIPQPIKNESNDLKALWTIGRQLITRNLPQVYEQIDAQQWPSYLVNIMRELREQTRQSAISLVNKSYSYIEQESLQKLVCAPTEEELNQLLTKMSWTSDGQDGIVVNKSQMSIEPLTSNQEQLQKLTEYVAFLEN